MTNSYEEAVLKYKTSLSETGDCEHYDVIIKKIDELIYYLKSIEIEAALLSYLEDDYLVAHKFYEDYTENPKSPSSESADKGRIAFGGLYELYKWIWTVKDSIEFEKLLKPHLRLLIQSTTRINSEVNMINPVTGKQDDQSNKFIETIVGFFAVAEGRNVELDDPIKSSNGDNPDVIFDFHDHRIAVACKTPRSHKSSSILDNIKSAVKQISRANCDIGYILINSMNIVDHSKIQHKIFPYHDIPFNILKKDIEKMYTEIITDNKEEIEELFSNNPKVSPFVITVLHSFTRIGSPVGAIAISLKETLACNFANNESSENQILFPHRFHEFIHNRNS